MDEVHILVEKAQKFGVSALRFSFGGQSSLSPILLFFLGWVVSKALGKATSLSFPTSLMRYTCLLPVHILPLPVQATVLPALRALHPVTYYIS